MLGNFGSVGWDNMPEDDYGGGEGGLSDDWEKERLYKFRFRMNYTANNPINPGRPVTHRVLILDAAPFCFFEHGLYNYRQYTKAYNTICLKKNNLGDVCPICEDGSWPRFMGMLSIIDLGQVEYKDKEMILHHRTWKNKQGETKESSFERKMLAAAKGNNETPGPLMKLQWESEKRGGTLEGTVWDATRTGKKEDGVGAKWDYIDRVAPEEYVSYLQRFGAPEDVNVKTIGDEFAEGDKSGWLEVCKVQDVNVLRSMVGGHSGGNDGGQKGGQGSTEGAGYDDGTPPDDPDIPF